MNLVIKKIRFPFARFLTLNPSYQIYIHLKDHDKKINPPETKLNLSYMDPKNIVPQSPKHSPFSAKLKRSANQELQKKLFEDYKQKILSGKIDEEQIIQPDPLWGDRQKPVHYYKNISTYQINLLSHSIASDVSQLKWNLVKGYIQKVKKITNPSQAKDLNDLVALAVNYRLNNQTDRQKYYEIQKAVSTKFHLLSDNSLILLKYAFLTSPKQCTPNFNRILNDLLTECLPNLSTTELIHLMYFNRYDHFRLGKDNLQLSILQQLQTRYEKLSLEEKIDFLFLYVDSRNPTIRKYSHDRHFNQIRNKTQQIICLVNLSSDFTQLSEQSIFKLTYTLVRSKTNKTEHLTNTICDYIHKNLNDLSAKFTALMLIYLAKIESNKSISNLDLLKSLKQKVMSNWAQLVPLDQIRCLDAMFEMNLFDEGAQQLYAAVPITADNTLLGHFCRLQMMNSSGRQWQIIHRLVDLDCLPLAYYQDYKRFYNYVSVTAPDWDLTALNDKLVNTEVFFNSLRFANWSMDKKIYSQIVSFQKFSGLRCLPKPFKLGCPIKNVQFAEFGLPQYQISLDIVTDVQRIKGTKDLKGSYQAKIKSLQNIGWKHLYVFEEDVENLTPLQFFDYIYSICEPYYEEQLKVIAAYEQYRAYQIEQLRQQRIKSVLSPKQLQRYLESHDYNIVFQDEEEIEQEEIARNLASGISGGVNRLEGTLPGVSTENPLMGQAKK